MLAACMLLAFVISNYTSVKLIFCASTGQVLEILFGGFQNIFGSEIQVVHFCNDQMNRILSEVIEHSSLCCV